MRLPTRGDIASMLAAAEQAAARPRPGCRLPPESIDALRLVGRDVLFKARTTVAAIADMVEEEPLVVARNRYTALRKFAPLRIEVLEFKSGRESAPPSARCSMRSPASAGPAASTMDAAPHTIRGSATQTRSIGWPICHPSFCLSFTSMRTPIGVAGSPEADRHLGHAVCRFGEEPSGGFNNSKPGGKPTYMVSLFSILFVLPLSVAPVASAAATAWAAPKSVGARIDGVWQSQGYGHLLIMRKGVPTLYHAAGPHCYRDPKPDAGSDESFRLVTVVRRDRIAFAEAPGQTRYVFDRIAKLNRPGFVGGSNS